ncbi:MAG TPA: hydrogenase maturation protease [Vicinamibacterales bacterium]|nr:hydrogenase maturation protease [Vicinamibacterales bacterium]HPK71920.1 hydrogenase maturation protease [Vicinamibacterales bacterium]
MDSGAGSRGPGPEHANPVREATTGFSVTPDLRDGVLVLCLGNDLLRDDGVGWAVADALEARLAEPGVASPALPVCVRRSALSGFYLLDELTGWDRAVVVDAVQTGRHPAGTVLSFPFEALKTKAGPSPHAMGLPSVVRLGCRSGVPLPARIHVVAVEAEDTASCAEGLTPAVARAVPEAVEEVWSVLARLGTGAPA